MTTGLEHIKSRIRNPRNWAAIAILVAAVYLLFFDNDSIIYQYKISREIRSLENENQHLKTEIQKAKKLLHNFDRPEYLEKYAREEFLFRKPNEDIYLIRIPDSLKK